MGLSVLIGVRDFGVGAELPGCGIGCYPLQRHYGHK